MKQPHLLRKAEQYCKAGKHRFTTPRARVLSVLANTSKPMGAYQIIEALSSDKTTINPPTVYRAIEFWSQHGFIHRVQSMNAYIACAEEHHPENFCIFICDDCQDVLELKIDFSKSLTDDLQKKHLIAASANTQIHGTCNNCQR